MEQPRVLIMEQPRVLIVEDEAALLDMLGDALGEAGFTVTATNRSDLDDIVHGVPPQVFLIDLMLPQMDGIQLAALLRLRGFRDTAMIGMSASSVHLHRAARSGIFQEVLAKPFDLSELISCVRRHASPA